MITVVGHLVATSTAQAVYVGCHHFYKPPKIDSFERFEAAKTKPDCSLPREPLKRANEGIRIKPYLASGWLYAAAIAGSFIGAAALPVIPLAVGIGIALGLLGFSSDFLLHERNAGAGYA